MSQDRTRSRRWLRRLFLCLLGLVSGACLALLVLLLEAPPLLERLLDRELHRRGLTEISVRVQGISRRSLVLGPIALGRGQDRLTVDTVRLGFDWRGLRERRLREIAVSGLTATLIRDAQGLWRLAGMEALAPLGVGIAASPVPAPASEPAAAASAHDSPAGVAPAAPGLAIDRISVHHGLVRIRAGDGLRTVPVDGTANLHGDGRFSVQAALLLDGAPVTVGSMGRGATGPAAASVRALGLRIEKLCDWTAFLGYPLPEPLTRTTGAIDADASVTFARWQVERAAVDLRGTGWNYDGTPIGDLCLDLNGDLTGFAWRAGLRGRGRWCDGLSADLEGHVRLQPGPGLDLRGTLIYGSRAGVPFAPGLSLDGPGPLVLDVQGRANRSEAGIWSAEAELTQARRQVRFGSDLVHAAGEVELRARLKGGMDDAVAELDLALSGFSGGTGTTQCQGSRLAAATKVTGLSLARLASLSSAGVTVTSQVEVEQFVLADEGRGLTLGPISLAAGLKLTAAEGQPWSVEATLRQTGQPPRLALGQLCTAREIQLGMIRFSGSANHATVESEVELRAVAGSSSGLRFACETLHLQSVVRGADLRSSSLRLADDADLSGTLEVHGLALEHTPTGGTAGPGDLSVSLGLARDEHRAWLVTAAVDLAEQPLKATAAGYSFSGQAAATARVSGALAHATVRVQSRLTAVNAATAGKQLRCERLVVGADTQPLDLSRVPAVDLSEVALDGRVECAGLALDAVASPLALHPGFLTVAGTLTRHAGGPWTIDGSVERPEQPFVARWQDAQTQGRARVTVKVKGPVDALRAEVDAEFADITGGLGPTTFAWKQGRTQATVTNVSLAGLTPPRGPPLSARACVELSGAEARRQGAFEVSDVAVRVPFAWDVVSGLTRLPDDAGQAPAGFVRIGRATAGPAAVTAMAAAVELQSGGVRFTGSGALPVPPAPLHVDGELRLTGPQVTAQAGFTIGPFTLSPDDTWYNELGLPGVNLAGKVGIEGRAVFADGALNTSAVINVHEGELEIRKSNLNVSGIETRIGIADVFGLRTEAHQELRFAAAKLGTMVVDGGRIVFHCQSARDILIEHCELAWCGGRVQAHAVRLDPANPEFDLVLYADSVDVGRILKTIEGFHGSATGSLYGRLPLAYHKGRFHYSDGFLYSVPGEGGSLKFAEPGLLTKAIPQSDPSYRNLALAEEALKDFQFSLFKINFGASGTTDACLKLELEGRSAAEKDLPPVHLGLNIRGALEDYINYGLRMGGL